MGQTVIGFFDDASDAQRAVERLQGIGISNDRIDTSRGQQPGTTGVSNERDADRDSDRDRQSGIERFFSSLFGSDDDDSKRYAKVGETCSIVTVHANTAEEAERAADLLDDCGAVDVDERSAQYGYTGNDSSRSRESGPGHREDMSSDRDLNKRTGKEQRETSIPKIQENLKVDKRTEERGGVRVRSRIVERPVEEHVRLREEHINVERQPANRPVEGDELENFKEKNIELTERSEVPVVNKEARVVEEVKISKDVRHRDETIKDNVRHTEVDVDRTNQNDRRDIRTEEERRNLRNDDDISKRRD